MESNKMNDPAYHNPNNPQPDDAPPDPSNTTSNVGQRVEQGVISKTEGLAEQSARWEDSQEKMTPSSLIPGEAEKYLKDPSPEEVNHEDDEDDAESLNNRK